MHTLQIKSERNRTCASHGHGCCLHDGVLLGCEGLLGPALLIQPPAQGLQEDKPNQPCIRQWTVSDSMIHNLDDVNINKRLTYGTPLMATIQQGMQ